jgi:hypothetical protein
MAFHREWHATQEERGRHFWETVRDPSLDQLACVVAALEAVRPVSARPKFVADLRARLMAEATANKGLDPPGGPCPSGVPSRRLGPVREAPSLHKVAGHD